jgi:hypothetical protein
MILKHIYLYLNLLEFPDKLVTPFGFKTRYVCNYLERAIKPLKFESGDFNKILVQGRRQPEDFVQIGSEHSVIPKVSFDEDRYLSLSASELHEFFIAMLLEGFHKTALKHRIPLAELKLAISEFRRLEYKNEWVHQKKLLRASGVTATLRCSLDTERFTLTLILERGSRVLFAEEILSTKPDEIIFAHKFKDVILDGDQIRVLDKFKKEMFAIELKSIAK